MKSGAFVPLLDEEESLHAKAVAATIAASPIVKMRSFRDCISETVGIG